MVQRCVYDGSKDLAVERKKSVAEDAESLTVDDIRCLTCRVILERYPVPNA